MLDYRKVANDRIAQWEAWPTDNPNSVNGFEGEWNISDHSLIPDCVTDFCLEQHPKKDRISQIPLEDINEMLNSVWEGPGSMPKLVALTEQIRELRREGETGKIDVANLGNTVVESE